MSRIEQDRFGWRGASFVAITYVYFLIFAQFAFLRRLASFGLVDAHLKTVMAAMAMGGILLSLITPRLGLWPSPTLRIRIGFSASGIAAFLSLFSLGIEAALAVAFLIGAGLGLLTVTLATHLRSWIGDRNPLVAVGAGTGIGYLVSNFPPLFAASAEVQALSAGILCIVGIGITLLPADLPLKSPVFPSGQAIPFYRVLAGFTALVWLDSAAFFIIQNTASLKAGTWEGTFHLWANGMLHLGAAIASALILRRKGLSSVLTAAFFALGCACLLLGDPDRALLASVFYPIGVSLYSVALVAYPSLISPASTVAERGRMAGWIYAIAGWIGSAMGIGMGQNLGHVPAIFVAVAGAAVLLPQLISILRKRTREMALVVSVLLVAALVDRCLRSAKVESKIMQIERGRQVYISEGCIHCHSQYVRPNSPDELMWGPIKSIQEIRVENPPLIGNRRQGPDLAEVGGRRSALWLKAHLYNPVEVSGSSIMPSYGFLFRDERGDDLVAYLESLHSGDAVAHQTIVRHWRPSAAAVAKANLAEGKLLYEQDCANCHSANGHVRRQWQSSFNRMPPDLAKGSYLNLLPSGFEKEQALRLDQITKFGVPGTDMPGHEYLSDTDVASITLWVSQILQRSNQGQ